MSNHRLSAKVSRNVFRKNAVKDKKINTTEYTFRGGIRL